MTRYVPILKAKAGEYKAWRNATPSVLAQTHPLFEVVPTKGHTADLQTAINGMIVGWPIGAHTVTIDTGHLDQTVAVATTADGPVLWVAKQLDAAGISARPVVRMGDDPAVIVEASMAARIHGQGVCLRLGGGDDDPDLDIADSGLTDLLRDLGLSTSEVHLLIDYSAMPSSRSVGRVLPAARAAVTWAHARGPWASVTVASGAFPASVSNLPTGTSTGLSRYDADMYNQLIASGLPLKPDYGDYAVNHPAMPTPGARGPLPNLRQTVDAEWHVWREKKNLPGHESFGTLCRSVVAATTWIAAGYCWGDAEVGRCASGAGGMGGATEWRAYGSSRHFQVVTDRLTTLGAA